MYKISYLVKEASNDKAQKYLSMRSVKKGPNMSLSRSAIEKHMHPFALTLSASQTVFKKGRNTWGLASAIRAITNPEKR